MAVVQFIPATPEAIKALQAGPDLIMGLTRSEIVSIVAIVISLVTTVMVTRHQLRATRQRDREVAAAAAAAERRDAEQRNITTTLDFHREYNAPELGEVREEARRFVLRNSGIDWENDPELMRHDVDGARAVALFELMRFFQRVEVVRKLGRLDEALLHQLLGHEIAWWQGLVFDPMGRRPSSRTLPAVRDLIAALRTPDRAAAWDEVVASAAAYRQAASQSRKAPRASRRG